MEIELSEGLYSIIKNPGSRAYSKTVFVFGVGIGRRNWDCPAFV
ncbi:MAG: hypothetical protein ACLVFM_10425 [Blautia faecis]